MARKTDDHANQPLEETLKARRSDASYGLRNRAGRATTRLPASNELLAPEEVLTYRMLRREGAVQ